MGEKETTAYSSPEPILTPMLLALTLVTGLIDAVSFLALERVFTANMTGNFVFLAFALGGVKGMSVARSGTALVSFIIGAVIAGRIATGTNGSTRHRWTSVAFGAEVVLLAVGSVVAIGQRGEISNDLTRLYALIVLTGVAMGIRNAVVRKLAVPDLTTTLLTITTAALASDSALAGGSRGGWRRRTAAIGSMVTGAAVGAWLLRVSVALPLALSALITGVCAVAAYYGMRRSARTGVPARS
jgi:uncharacterized membrane protein YoaK (UPF0700 family)